MFVSPFASVYLPDGWQFCAQATVDSTIESSMANIRGLCCFILIVRLCYLENCIIVQIYTIFPIQTSKCSCLDKIILRISSSVVSLLTKKCKRCCLNPFSLPFTPYQKCRWNCLNSFSLPFTPLLLMKLLPFTP